MTASKGLAPRRAALNVLTQVRSGRPLEAALDGALQKLDEDDRRLAHEMAPERTVVTLDTFGCLCSTMFRISPNHLLWALEGLVDGEVYNHIVVAEPTRTWAKVALDRMLAMV